MRVSERGSDTGVNVAGRRPDLEIRRQVRPGTYRVYATFYRRPLRVWVWGRWLIGRPAKDTRHA